ncbi:MAG: serpin family protein [bacterium]|nr:serpin family protein [bacterium]
MKRIYSFFMSLLVLILITGNVFSNETVVNKKDLLVNGNNTFALELYANLKNNEGNLFFSPYSISTALAMTYAGAKGNTQTQMAEVLHFGMLDSTSLHPAFKDLIAKTQKENKNYQLNIANALWGQKGYKFLNEFLEVTKINYGAGFNEVDFGDTESARKTINDWVEEQTKNKIKELIKPGILNGDTRLVLTNAIYFKGDWVNEFDKKGTKKAPFYVKPDKKVQVLMMSKKEPFNFMEADKFQAIELPYKGNNLSMFVLLPKKIDGLAELENFLVFDSLNKWIESLKNQEVRVFFPKFKTTSEFSLKEVLESMGMSDAFSLPPADFSGITETKELFISAVIHKAFVDVNEKGTEAAAATAVVMTKGFSMSEKQIPVFRADHPFIFLIRDNRSGSILFIGRLTNPLK